MANRNFEMKYILTIILLISLAKAQGYKSFKVLDNGDTMNIVDANNLKQGKWKNHIPALRLDPEADEEGIYVNGKKEGIWRRYDMYGLLLCKENYKWGSKNGLQQYLFQGQLEHDEMWRAVDPEKQYDTIDVIDPLDQFKVDKKVVKIESYSTEHGLWKYYDPESGRVVKTINYFLGKEIPLQQPSTNFETPVKDTVKPKVKPKAVLDFEKSNKGKKKVQVRDGATG